MFTGIIEETGVVLSVLGHDGIKEMTIQSELAPELHVDQSLCHDGVCLTVVYTSADHYRVQLVRETWERSTFKDIKTGHRVNLERAMAADGRFEGHIVQGHVDCTGTYEGEENGLWRFSFPSKYAELVVEKGSVCINGVSLTVARLEESAFSVALIPYTLDYTNLGDLSEGDIVNLEFDILGKYLARIAQFK